MNFEDCPMTPPFLLVAADTKLISGTSLVNRAPEAWA
jgi:hypothetical protein